MAEGKKNIGAVWKRVSKDGKTPYLSMILEINGVRRSFTIFKNGYKETEKHPDMVVYETTDNSGSSFAPKSNFKGTREYTPPVNNNTQEQRQTFDKNVGNDEGDIFDL